GGPVGRRPGGRGVAGLGNEGGTGPAPTEAVPATPVSVQAERPATLGGAGIPLEAPVRVTADPATNALVVSATPADWATLRDVIEELDIRRPQVFVEAIILEATLDNMRALGVEFRATAQLDGAVGLAQTNLNPL